MNEIQELYEQLKAIYPNRTIVLDEPRWKDIGVWWLDIDRVGIIYDPKRGSKFEVFACPPGCISENHYGETAGDIFLNTKEETINFVRNLLDNNKYTHEVIK